MNKHLVVIPFNIPWEWSTDYLNQTAFELSKRGDIVLCYLAADSKNLHDLLFRREKFSLVKKFSKNIYIITPFYFVPFRRFKLIEAINSTINLLILKMLSEYLYLIKKCNQKTFWLFNPNLRSMFNKFGSSYKFVYDCVDFFAIDSKDNIKNTIRNEKYLCRNADLVVANSHVLQDHLKKWRKDVKLVVQGFRVLDIPKGKLKKINLNLKKPIIGFVGGINRRLDYDLLLNLAKKNSTWNFVIWGPILEKEKIDKATWNKMEELFSLPNVTTGASQDKTELPGIISQFDIGMIPYDISQDFNKYCHPMKLFEYFDQGIPVISTNILELNYFKDLVRIEDNYKGWQKGLEAILSVKWSKSNIQLQKQLSEENSWENKVKAIVEFIDE